MAVSKIQPFERSSLAHCPSRNLALLSGYSVMTKSMLGSGLLGIAFACGEAGYVVAIGCFVLAAIACVFSLHLMADMALVYADKDGKINFYSLTHQICPKITWLVDFFIAIKSFGAAVAYVQVSGGMIASVVRVIMEENGVAESVGLSTSKIKLIVQGSMVVLLSPACFCKEITQTRIPNLIGIICFAYVGVISIFFSHPGEGDTSLWPSSFTGVLSRLPVFIFAFACQQNMFPVVEETPAKHKSTRFFDIVCQLATATGILIYAPVMLLPYSTFGSDIQDNFLRNLDVQNVWVKAAYLSAALSVSISYPLQIHPFRRSLVALLRRGKEFGSSKEEFRWRIALTTILLGATLATAMSVKSLGLTMQLSGLLGGNTVCFLMPSFLYIYAFKSNHEASQRTKVWRGAIALFSVMGTFLPVALGSIIYERSR